MRNIFLPSTLITTALARALHKDRAADAHPATLAPRYKEQKYHAWHATGSAKYWYHGAHTTTVTVTLTVTASPGGANATATTTAAALDASTTRTATPSEDLAPTSLIAPSSAAAMSGTGASGGELASSSDALQAVTVSGAATPGDTAAAPSANDLAPLTLINVGG
ncbi:hypothetical protein ACN47E_004277 [Coniothyrium glycines]